MAKYIKLEDLMKFPIRLDHYDKKHGDINFVYGIETVLEYAENLPTTENGVTVQEWISVNDRLPKDGVRVLALHNDGIVRIGISRGYFPSIVSRTNTKSFGIAEVTHWMPLPSTEGLE